MSKKSKNIARFIRAAMRTYPNLRPFAAVTHYGAWLMSENKRLKKMLLSCGVQMQKPLTHEEAENILNSGDPVWHEEREDMYRKSHWVIPDGINSGWLDTNMYGFSWRCWKSRPTYAERAAASWLSEPSEDA